LLLSRMIAAGAITADDIKAGTMSASRIRGDELTLGGMNNQSGVLVFRDNEDMEFGRIDSNGLTGSIFGSAFLATPVGAYMAGRFSTNNDGIKYEQAYLGSGGETIDEIQIVPVDTEVNGYSMFDLALRFTRRALDTVDWTETFRLFHEGSFPVQVDTFTPQLIGSTSGEATYTSRSGRYWRFGPMFFALVEIAVNTRGTMSGNARIGGLPFTPATNIPVAWITFVGVNNATGASVSMLISDGTLRKDSAAYVLATDITNGATLRFHAWGICSD